MHISARAPRLRATFADAGIDALLVTRLPNIRYLTGFTGSAATLLVTPDDLVFVTDGRYAEQSAEQLGGAGVDARIEIGATQVVQREALGDAVKPFAAIGARSTWRHVGAATRVRRGVHRERPGGHRRAGRSSPAGQGAGRGRPHPRRLRDRRRGVRRGQRHPCRRPDRARRRPRARARHAPARCERQQLRSRSSRAGPTARSRTPARRIARCGRASSSWSTSAVSSTATAPT